MKGFYLFTLFVLQLSIASKSYSQGNVVSTKENGMKPGAALLPIPKQVSLSNERYTIDDSWTVVPAISLSKNDPAVANLIAEAKERFGLRLKIGKAGAGRAIHLNTKPGSVTIGKTIDTSRNALKQDAYHLKLDAQQISITGNAASGLFYGVQTLLQLLETNNGDTRFVTGEITDWPDLQLRMIYWDDAHHLDRLNAMKRAIKQAGFYKINGFALKLEGHFQFKGAKPIVEPHAYSAAEYQELTDYAKKHYVDLVPYIDAPAHISFILKHPEYKDLRNFPNSNYDFTVLSKKADDLLLGMFDELLEANKGGKYVFFSTDEAYYVGKSEAEKKPAEAAGGNGRLLAQYISRIANKLHAKGRKVIFWGEAPLMPSDVTSLPSHLINGINENSEVYGSKFKEHGIRNLVFTSTQGVEPLFPSYYKLPSKTPAVSATGLPLSDDELQQGDLSNGRVGGIIKAIDGAIKGGKSDLMGVIVCGWADAGLNTETFWLGYAAGLAGAWNTKSLNVADLSQRFYYSFYGRKAVDMDKVYQLLSTQAQFWNTSWDIQLARSRTPIVGNSFGIFDTPRLVKDHTLPMLPVPEGNNLSVSSDWSYVSKERIQNITRFLKENDFLMRLLKEQMETASYQHYNLQVFFTIAQLCRQNLNMLLGLQKISQLVKLSSVVSSTQPGIAVSLLDDALETVHKIQEGRDQVLQSVSTVWYRDWYPLVPEANGRKYVHQVDDVKDHPPVRTIDLSYLVYRQLKYPLDRWVEQVVQARNEFALKKNLPLRSQNHDTAK